MRLLTFMDRNAGKLLILGVVVYTLLFIVAVVQGVFPDLTARIDVCAGALENPGLAREVGLECSTPELYAWRIINGIQALLVLLGGAGWTGGFVGYILRYVRRQQIQ